MTTTHRPAREEAPSPRARLDQAERWLRHGDLVDVVLRFSLVALVAASHHHPVAMAVAAVATVVLLAQPRLLHHPGPWLAGALALAVWQVPRWYEFDNHVWLTTYWILAVGISLTTSRRDRTLAVNGRLLIGSTFALAAAWKLGSPEFRSGEFFHHALLLDDRFSFVTEHLGGLRPAESEANRHAARALAANPDQWVPLHTTGAVRATAAVFTVWGALIEVAVAVLWLWPLRSRRWARHVALLAFMGTTYAVVPIGGFGCLLVAMALTQAGDAPRLRLAYAGAFVALLAYGPIWQAVFA